MLIELCITTTALLMLALLFIIFFLNNYSEYIHVIIPQRIISGLHMVGNRCYYIYMYIYINYIYIFCCGICKVSKTNFDCTAINVLIDVCAYCV